MTQAPHPTALQRQEAAQWLVRLDDEGADEGLAMAFVEWLEGEPGRREAFAAVEAAWVDIDLAGPDALAEPEGATVIPLAPRRRVRPGAWIWTGAAAAAVIALAVGVTQMATSTKTYETPVGQSQQVALADGSKITLAGGSRLEVRARGKTRSATLARGEADFDIIHDPNSPFEVAAGADTVRVLGTHFDVARNAQSLTVTVQRGLVSVDRPDDGRDPVLVAAGNQLRRHDGAADQMRGVEDSEAAAWRTGRLVYRDRPLAEVTEDLSRYLPVPVSTAPEVANLPVTGVLNISDEEAMVERLQTFLHVQATKTSSGIRLERAKD
jgi:transmembrane sensor